MKDADSEILKVIDLRSDTLTLPTPSMLEAMGKARVGDDVFGEDPTVNQLESTVAQLLGKEAALFVTSGTMANQLALRAHTNHGDRVLMDEQAHVYHYEAGALAAISGLMPVLVKGENGLFNPGQIRDHLLPENVHFAPLTLVCMENTHNRGGGTVWSKAQMREIHCFCMDEGLKLHLDGARLWNASVALNESMEAMAAHCDSVSVCFSKGLGAPVGSILAGSSAFISKARRFRKQLGGGMRQSGYLAAACLYALNHHLNRLAEDHLHAKQLARGLALLKGIELDPDKVETNILYFKTNDVDAAAWVAEAETKGVKMLAIGPNRVRAVTHLMVSKEAVESALRRLSTA